MKESHMEDLNSFRVLLTDEEVEEAMFDPSDPKWTEKRARFGGLLIAAVASELDAWERAVKEQKDDN